MNLAKKRQGERRKPRETKCGGRREVLESEGVLVVIFV
jgi:hypothetical protein